MSAAVAFHALHHRDRPLLLPNAWDMASAAVLAGAGFPAIGTTSLGVAAAHGLPDATGQARTPTVALAHRLCRLPTMITVDIEAGFSDDPERVADLVAELAQAGAVGVNLEDGRPGGVLAEPERQARLLHAVKRCAPEVFLNARIDTYWLSPGRLPSLAGTLERARRYRDAGADGIFVPGLNQPGAIGTLTAEVPLPVNVLYAPGGATLAELAALGVRRVSTGSLLFRTAVRAAVAAAEQIRDGEPVTGATLSYAEIQRVAGGTR